MNRLTPLSRHVPASLPSGGGAALVITACKSLPASGSVRTIAPVTLPDENIGRYFAFVSGSANSLMVSAMSWSPKIVISPASARLTISMAIL